MANTFLTPPTLFLNPAYGVIIYFEKKAEEKILELLEKIR
jgi:hypothetical protein